MRRFVIIIVLLVCNLFSFGQNQNISQGFVFDGEPYISIDPDNSQHMVVAWMSWTLTDRIVIKTRTSFDGGQSWSAAVKLPHVATDNTSADVSMEFDQSGDIFLSYIDFSGFDSEPLSGAVYVSKSTDGGLNWNNPTVVISVDSDPGKRAIDRPWISIDRSGGPNTGNIYVTSMNAKNAVATGGFNPYLTVSTDGGNSFGPWQYLDTTDWLAGFFIPQPMPTNTVSSTGIFHAVYPSFVFAQNPLAQFIIASSADGGNSFSYHSVLTSENNVNDPLAKKGYLLISDPADAEHLVFVYLNIPVNDIDVYLTESFDGGVSWSEGIRINDDPIGNSRMQDLLWTDFDYDGDLVISWRDRRNGSDSTYTTASEIMAAVRLKDASDFSANFSITDSLIPYDTILGFSGNDFMCIKLVNDTLNAVWGDARNGKLNIWFQRTDINGVVQSIQQLASDEFPNITTYPNPTVNQITIKGDNIQRIIILDQNLKQVAMHNNNPGIEIINLEIDYLPAGIYFFKIETNEGVIIKKIIKE